MATTGDSSEPLVPSTSMPTATSGSQPLATCWYKLTTLHLNRFKYDYPQAHRYHTSVTFYLEVLNIISIGNNCDDDIVYRLDPTIRLDRIKKKEITNALWFRLR